MRLNLPFSSVKIVFKLQGLLVKTSGLKVLDTDMEKYGFIYLIFKFLAFAQKVNQRNYGSSILSFTF